MAKSIPKPLGRSKRRPRRPAEEPRAKLVVKIGDGEVQLEAGLAVVEAKYDQAVEVLREAFDREQLASQARREGVSLNQYLVYMVARYSGPAYSVRPSETSAEEQKAAFARLREQLGSASPEEDAQALADLRQPGPPDPELTPELLERARRSLSARSE